MGIQARFIDFHNAIKISKKDELYSNARKKDSSITEAVKLAFKEAGYPVIDDFIQGSFATDTAIIRLNGDFDIDRAIVINADNAPANPVDPKKIIYGILENRGFKNAKIKKPCVTADYLNENLHIDLPVYRLKNGCHELAIGKLNSDEANRAWSASDPIGMKAWITNSTSYGNSANSKQQQFNRIVCYLKRWRDEKFSEAVSKKIYSIGLTVMAKKCFSPVFDNDSTPNDLQALKNTVSNILRNGFFIYQGNDQYKVTVNLPVSPYRDIFHGSSIDTGTQLKNKLTNMESKLNDATTEEDEIKKCKILNSLFGQDFIVPEPAKASTQVKKAVFPTAGAVGTSQGA